MNESFVVEIIRSLTVSFHDKSAKGFIIYQSDSHKGSKVILKSFPSVLSDFRFCTNLFEDIEV